MIKVVLWDVDGTLLDFEKAEEAGIKANDPWWVIVLKVISYIIAAVLAGVATTSCSHLMGII